MGGRHDDPSARALCKEAAVLSTDQQAMIRARLEAERTRLLDLIQGLDEQLEQLSTGEAGEHPAGDHLADIGSDLGEQETMLTLESNEREILVEVERALRRLDEGVYGQCERCGQPIPYERLEALPYATRCIQCQAAVERERR
jgi:DnaK suppressor protein